jgi:hypothetical protein
LRQLGLATPGGTAGVTAEAVLREPEMSREKLELLLELGYLECVPGKAADRPKESWKVDSRPQAPRRGKQSLLTSPLFREGMVLVLTLQGAECGKRIWTALGGALPARDSEDRPLLVPRWDARCRELWYGELLLKRFVKAAPIQELLLAAFERAGWPLCMADPLPEHPGVSPEERLHNALRRLNASLVIRVIQFIRDGSARGVGWKVHENRLKAHGRQARPAAGERHGPVVVLRVREEGEGGGRRLMV